MLPPIYTWLKDSAAVQAIAGTRVYRHASAPQDTTRPYVTWQMIAGVPENNLTATPPIDRISVQVDCWHQTDAGVENLAIAVRDAIEPYAHMTGMPINEREVETKLYRIGLQFDCWVDRPDTVPFGATLLALSGDQSPGQMLLSGDQQSNGDALVI